MMARYAMRRHMVRSYIKDHPNSTAEDVYFLEDGHVYCEGIVFYALPGEEWEEYDCM